MFPTRRFYFCCFLPPSYGLRHTHHKPVYMCSCAVSVQSVLWYSSSPKRPYMPYIIYYTSPVTMFVEFMQLYVVASLPALSLFLIFQTLFDLVCIHNCTPAYLLYVFLFILHMPCAHFTTSNNKIAAFSSRQSPAVRRAPVCPVFIVHMHCVIYKCGVLVRCYARL